jgi:molybdate transport repressor ModE-like protein
MGMAYSKAWRIIRTAENVFGCKLLNSSIGGQHGGGAVLTSQAVSILAAYDAYCADVKAYSDAKFEASFGFYKTLDVE